MQIDCSLLFLIIKDRLDIAYHVLGAVTHPSIDLFEVFCCFASESVHPTCLSHRPIIHEHYLARLHYKVNPANYL